MTIDLLTYDYAKIFNIYQDEDGFYFLNIYNNIVIEGDIDPTLYTIHRHDGNVDNWYSLSYRYYGTTQLWWLILIANNISDAFEDIQAGTEIKILKSNVVSDILQQIALSK